MLLGIDFGTSYCSLSRLNPKSGLPEVILDENDGNKIPSLVFWGINEIKVGKAAEEIFNESQMMSESEQLDILHRTIKSIKRNLSKEYCVSLPNGELVSSQQVVAEIFKYLKRTAERGCSCTNIHRVSLTHPVDFSEEQKNLLKLAATTAGFSEIQLLPEPIAAAKGYFATSGILGQNILVFDLGAGTLDLSFVHQDPHHGYHLPVLPLGKFDCGGDDFDQLLYDYLEKVYVSQGEPTFCDNVDFINLSVMLQCRMAKEKLSRNEEIRFKASVKHSAIKITREQFNKVISRKIEECTTLTKQMLRNIKNAGYQVDTVLLIGGSSRIPFLRDELEKILPVKPLQTMYADIAVALGAVADIKITLLHSTSSEATDKTELVSFCKAQCPYCGKLSELEYGKINTKIACEMCKNDFIAYEAVPCTICGTYKHPNHVCRICREKNQSKEKSEETETPISTRSTYSVNSPSGIWSINNVLNYQSTKEISQISENETYKNLLKIIVELEEKKDFFKLRKFYSTESAAVKSYNLNFRLSSMLLAYGKAYEKGKSGEEQDDYKAQWCYEVVLSLNVNNAHAAEAQSGLNRINGFWHKAFVRQLKN